jgi:hypothetical protein
MKLDGFEQALIVIFFVTLPFVNPLVRGDGVGYYAYVRSLLIQHNLRFENDWIHSSSPFIGRTVNAEGRIGSEYTATGHLTNRYSVGPSLLWAPPLVPVHLVAKALASAGVKVTPDGFSLPYLLTCSLATALYGFLGLWISFSLARRYVEEKWIFIATLGMWFASSLPVYMYFNPFYSHAQSVFVVALFLWYWQQTRTLREFGQWLLLGVVAGLMLDVYYINVALLAFPLLESANKFRILRRGPGNSGPSAARLLLGNLTFAGAAFITFLPTLITRKIIYGSPLVFGYDPSDWSHPKLWQPLLSSNHGLISWTPIVLPAFAGLILLWRYDREFAACSWASCGVLYCIVAAHPDWHGISSFGNRFFISLIPLFVLGFAVFLQECSRWFNDARAPITASAAIVCILILWNLAFIFQWGTGLIPHVGPISWRRMAYNQFRVVPSHLGGNLATYFTHRMEMMERIEREDARRFHTL